MKDYSKLQNGSDVRGVASDLLGKEVNVIRLDQIVGRGTVVGIDSDARLILRLPNGEETALSSGEVSVRGL